VCSDGMNFAAHDGYAGDGGVIGEGADFAASHLGAGGTQVANATPHHGFGD
jgi:cutinase